MRPFLVIDVVDEGPAAKTSKNLGRRLGPVSIEKKRPELGGDREARRVRFSSLYQKGAVLNRGGQDGRVFSEPFDQRVEVIAIDVVQCGNGEKPARVVDSA